MMEELTTSIDKQQDKADPTIPSAYTLLCMLDTVGKLLERMLKSGVDSGVESARGLSNWQHRCRREHSTISAIN